MRISALACFLLLIASSSTAEPIASGAVQVIDRDTISTRGDMTWLTINDARRVGIDIETLQVQAATKKTGSSKFRSC